MMVWSTQYDNNTEAPATCAKAFRQNPGDTIKWYEAGIDRVDAEIRPQTE